MTDLGPGKSNPSTFRMYIPPDPPVPMEIKAARRPYPHRPPAEYRPKSRVICFGTPNGSNWLRGDGLMKMENGAKIQLWPAQREIPVNKTRAQGPSERIFEAPVAIGRWSHFI